MSASDQLAYQIGRTILDLHIARQAIETQQQRIAELEARLAEYENAHGQNPAPPEPREPADLAV